MVKKPYTKRDMDAVSRNPEWTKEDFANSRSFRDVFPDLAKTIRTRGPQKTPTKQLTSIRLSPEVLSHYKSLGPGWQSRIDDDLKKITKRKRA